MRPGTRIEVRTADGWEAATIAKQPKGGYPVPGYYAVTFADGGGIAVHESGFRVVGGK